MSISTAFFSGPIIVGKIFKKTFTLLQLFKKKKQRNFEIWWRSRNEKRKFSVFALKNCDRLEIDHCSDLLLSSEPECMND